MIGLGQPLKNSKIKNSKNRSNNVTCAQKKTKKNTSEKANFCLSEKKLKINW